MKYPATLLCDFYKLSHREQYPEGTTKIYSTWTPRESRIDGIDGVVAFGYQAFIQEYLVDYFRDNFFSRPLIEVVHEYTRFVHHTLGIDDPAFDHIEALHRLGYLPLSIRAVKEGSIVPIRTPMLTVENTLPEFFWLTNYVETLMSLSLWKPSTSATLAFEYRRMLDKYCQTTGGNPALVQFQGHDFSMRGMDRVEAAAVSGAGHLLSFTGTDTIPAIGLLEEYYGANVENELIGCSIPATEHSVMCAYGKGSEYEAYKRLITEVYPSGFVSIVSDTYDLWKVLTETVAALKPQILSRDGKVVIRPDSGDPVEIICGSVEVIDLDGEEYCETLEDCKEYMEDYLIDIVSTETPHGECGEDTVEGYFRFKGLTYRIQANIDWNRYDKQYYYIDGHDIVYCKPVELTAEQKGVIEVLWDIFGGTVNYAGYKELDSHIGAIYGDAITLERCEEICRRLKDKGFCSTNMVYGIGSYTYQYNTRDTFGFAMKATYAVINGKETPIFKDPATDTKKVKKSQTGMVVVRKDEAGKIVGYTDGLNSRGRDEFPFVDALETIFHNGKVLRRQTLAGIRAKLRSQLV